MVAVFADKVWIVRDYHHRRVLSLLEKFNSALFVEARIAHGDDLINKKTFEIDNQRLLVDSQFAERQLATALTALNDARNEARRKQAYVERIVEPSIPDDALEPRRMRGVLSIAALGLVSWLVLRMLAAGIREHQD